MLKEFKTFALRGNVLDLAIGVILGAAFGKIVTSFVDDLLMPPLGLLVGGMDFSNLFLDLSRRGYATLEAAKAAGAPVVRYGVFINAVITFLIQAFAIFLLIKQVNRFFPKGAEAPVVRECPRCLSSIPLKATRCAHCTSDVTAVA